MGSSNQYSTLLLITICAIPFVAHGGDPDILTDFVVPPNTNASQIDGSFFTYSNLIKALDSSNMTKFNVSKATAAEFPALEGQSVSYVGLMYGPGTVNPPHIHPRASELLYVVQGTLFVGLVFSGLNNKLYTQTLQTGDMFVFPKGMVHFQFNNGNDMARAFSAFGSASPGTIPIPEAVFGSGIDDTILEKSFHTDEQTIDGLENDVTPAPAPPPTPVPAPSSSSAAALSRSALMLLCFGVAFL